MRNLGYAIAVALIPFAGQGWAGERQGEDAAVQGVAAMQAGMAWVGEYRVDEAQGRRNLTVILGSNRVEHRMTGQPLRIWLKTADGVAFQEADPVQHLLTTYAPGDLRALDRAPDWKVVARAPSCAEQATSCVWTLLSSHVEPEADAFTSFEDYREVDGADRGD